MRPKTLILIDPVGDHIRPVASTVFDAVNAPVDQVLARNCVALFLGPGGRVTRIEDIRLTQNSIAARVKLIAGRRAAAQVRFTDIPAEPSDLKLMIWDARAVMLRHGTPIQGWWLFGASDKDVQDALDGASTLAALYDALRLPPPESCMELL